MPFSFVFSVGSHILSHTLCVRDKECYGDFFLLTLFFCLKCGSHCLTFEILAESRQFIDPSKHFWVGEFIAVRRLENQQTGNTDEKRLLLQRHPYI